MKRNILLIIVVLFSSVGVVGLFMPFHPVGVQMQKHIVDVISICCLWIASCLFLIAYYSRIENRQDIRLLNMTLKYNDLLSNKIRQQPIKEDKYDVIKIQYKDDFDSNNLPPIEIQDKLIVDKMAEEISKNGIITCVKSNGIPQGRTSVTAFMNVLRMKY